MEKNKILIISNMYPNKNGGYFGIFVKKINENLKLSFDTKEVLLKGKSANNFIKCFRYLFFYLHIIFELCFNKYHVIYVHFPTHSLPPILFFPFLKNKNIVLNFHGSDIMLESKLNTLFIKHFRLIKLYVKFIVVSSKILEDEILKKIQFNNFFISPSGGIPDFFYDNLDNFKIVKTQNLRFLYISSLIESKGIFTLLDSVKQLYVKNGIELDLTIFGSGNTDLLQTKIQELNNTKYLGVADNDYLPYIFNDFDVLVFPTKRESLGLIGLEALACGIPVIASDIPSINSYIIHNFNGLLFELENSTDLMNNIEFLINNPIEYKRLQSNSRNSVLNFKQSATAVNLNKKINEII
jgi:glycosyltransferase involved in cell wall biosynthesis|tara:strand:+ start:337 stop:1395 length:1059 start_codon:yes stop_codon:yes gene_type:complete